MNLWVACHTIVTGTCPPENPVETPKGDNGTIPPLSDKESPEAEAEGESRLTPRNLDTEIGQKLGTKTSKSVGFSESQDDKHLLLSS